MIELIIEQGLRVTVREVAARAKVNHGLVHTYFGSKQQLVTAALDEMNRRAAQEMDEAGFPPPDLASRRGGELGKAIARVRLDMGSDLFSSHPVTSRWRDALTRTRPDLDPDEIQAMVAIAAAMGLGWAVFGEHICESLGLGVDGRASLDKRVTELVADLGGIPTHPADSSGG